MAREGRLRTDDDATALLEYMGEPRIGTRVRCTNPQHVPPFRFFADVLLGRTLDFICWANRSGSKSYLAGLLTWFHSYTIPGLNTTILGGSLDQSEKVYDAMNSCWALTGLQDQYLVGEPTRRITRWKDGSKVKILPASQKSTRGPHPHRLLMDEVDEMDEEVYAAALSQPQSSHGITASLGKLSTNHHFGGIMDQALVQAEEHGIPIYRWCIWECMASCRDYSCSTCPLTPYCPGTCMKDADGYYLPSDFIQKLHNLNEMILRVEWFCEKISRSDLVYGEQWDETLHCPLDLPGFSPDRTVSLSIDWGGSNPFSVGFWQQWPFGWVRFGEYYKGGTTNTRVIEACKALPWWSNIRDGVADPSRPDLIREWEDALADRGFRMTAADNAVEPGVEAVRNALRPVIGPPKYYVSRSGCKAWLREVKGYFERNGRPVKKGDHAMDETRYFVKWKIGLEPVREGFVFTPRFVTKGTEEKAPPPSLREAVEAVAAALEPKPSKRRYHRARPSDEDEAPMAATVAPPARREAPAVPSPVHMAREGDGFIYLPGQKEE